jgi:RNA binding exosome subunit
MVKLRSTSMRVFAHEAEYQAFINDLEQSETLSAKCILALREKRDCYVSEEDDGYYGEKILISTKHEIVMETGQ